MPKINIGVIGYGYWGPNIVRNFNSFPDQAAVVRICDQDAKARLRAEKTHPNISACENYKDITGATDIDVVAIVTPVTAHFPLAKDALQNGKHIFVEKPFTASTQEAEELIALADKKNLQIMVDHTFLFTGAVQCIKDLVDKDVLGKLYYYDSTRVNLGLFQSDVNVIWDLAPHDFSIMDHLIDDNPVAISATGIDHFGRGLENTAYVTVYFSENMIAHFNVNWLSPVKIRQTLIGGKNKMLVWNDLDADMKIKIYDKGVTIHDDESPEGRYKLLVDYRSGDITVPRVEHTEALKLEVEHFFDCLKNNKTPINNGKSGLRVVKLLEACDKSIKDKGKVISL